jgi:thiopeptide-type bacteriocin biosynthesis protein
VVLCEDERRLPLDLDHPLHRALLRARVDRAGQVELREAPTAEDLGFMGRAHEFLIALRSASQPPSGAGSENVACTRTAASADTAALPGASAFVLARIGGHPDRQNEILTEHLPTLFQDWDDPPPWWFSRRRDLARPDKPQHLDLHLHVRDPGVHEEALARIGEWAADLGAAGLVPDLELATYHPQPGRYGHGPALAAAHEVFTADSVAALAQIAITATGLSAEALTAASLFDLAVSYPTAPADGCRWLIDQIPHEHGPLDRSLRDTALRLADPAGNWATLRAQPGGELVLLAWEQRRAMLTVYRTVLAQQRDPDPVLRSLLHGHHVRALGVDPDRERLTHRLARAAAQRRTAQCPSADDRHAQ